MRSEIHPNNSKTLLLLMLSMLFVINTSCVHVFFCFASKMRLPSRDYLQYYFLPFSFQSKCSHHSPSEYDSSEDEIENPFESDSDDDYIPDSDESDDEVYPLPYKVGVLKCGLS